MRFTYIILDVLRWVYRYLLSIRNTFIRYIYIYARERDCYAQVECSDTWWWMCKCWKNSHRIDLFEKTIERRDSFSSYSSSSPSRCEKSSRRLRLSDIRYRYLLPPWRDSMCPTCGVSNLSHLARRTGILIIWLVVSKFSKIIPRWCAPYLSVLIRVKFFVVEIERGLKVSRLFGLISSFVASVHATVSSRTRVTRNLRVPVPLNRTGELFSLAQVFLVA